MKNDSSAQTKNQIERKISARASIVPSARPGKQPGDALCGGSPDMPQEEQKLTLEILPEQPDSETAFVWPFLTPDNRVGIDTIRLSVSDFEILPKNSLTIYSAGCAKERSKRFAKPQRWFDKPLFTNEDGREVVGALAFLTLKSGDTTLLINVQVRHGCVHQRTCTITFSAPRVQHGNNFSALKLEELQQVLSRVQNLLQDAGIVADLQEASLSRLDIFRDLRVLWPLHEYAAVIEQLHFRYGKIRRFYESTPLSPAMFP